MVRSTGRPVTCADCGALITGERISISATEQLCEDCWPFFLLPLVEEKGRGLRAPQRGSKR